MAFVTKNTKIDLVRESMLFTTGNTGSQTEDRAHNYILTRPRIEDVRTDFGLFLSRPPIVAGIVANHHQRHICELVMLQWYRYSNSTHVRWPQFSYIHTIEMNGGATLENGVWIAMSQWPNIICGADCVIYRSVDWLAHSIECHKCFTCSCVIIGVDVCHLLHTHMGFINIAWSVCVCVRVFVYMRLGCSRFCAGECSAILIAFRAWIV